MALVDDDDAKGIIEVVLGEETGKILVFFIAVDPQGLIGGDVNAGIAGGIAATFGPDCYVLRNSRDIVP
ncbi:MAG: hypothetical protein BECKG1743D_GA0114223_106733 [Candidatus Kentron sp. G]|nr:MAG: hypothetical protein BECKG1743D_GA0114223_106733 [Candidatus Kentron sp. G]